MMMPLVVPMNDAFMDLIFSGPVQLHLITIFDPKDEESFRTVQTMIEEVNLISVFRFLSVYSHFVISSFSVIMCVNVLLGGYEASR